MSGRGGTVEISLSQGMKALIDECDVEITSRFRWYANKNGRAFYAVSHTRGPHSQRRVILLHRLILGLLDAPRSTHVDHINGDGLDNRRANLRIATPKQNNGNRVGEQNCSGYKGVYPCSGYKWKATIGIGPGRYLGVFDNREDAARAYDAAARRIYGEFARPNFPMPGEFGAVVSAPKPFDFDAFVAADRAAARARGHRKKKKSGRKNYVGASE